MAPPSAARLDAADAPPHPARATRATSHPKAPCVVAARDGMLFVCTAISLHASLTPFLPAECSRSCAAGAQLWHDLARVKRAGLLRGHGGQHKLSALLILGGCSRPSPEMAYESMWGKSLLAFFFLCGDASRNPKFVN